MAAIKIRPFEVGGADRAALVCLAEQTPKGSRVSWASQEDLMATANVKTLSGIAKRTTHQATGRNAMTDEPGRRR